MRVTKKEIEGMFARYCKVMGFKMASSYGDVGGYQLDYANCYNGYTVERIENSDGGVSRPFCNRLPSREFYEALLFAIHTVNIMKTLRIDELKEDGR